jgi:hypothetical protein
MVTLSMILLVLLAAASGLARRAWWEMGLLTLLAWGSVQVVDLWIGSWRSQAGLPRDEFFIETSATAWLLIGVGVYASYAAALIYARWRMPPGAPDR